MNYGAQVVAASWFNMKKMAQSKGGVTVGAGGAAQGLDQGRRHQLLWWRRPGPEYDRGRT